MNVTQHRTQLYLDEERYLYLQELAKTKEKSIAQIIRETIDEVRKKKEASAERKKRQVYQGLLKMIGSIKKGPKDGSINHDKYIAESINEELVKKRK